MTANFRMIPIQASPARSTSPESSLNNLCDEPWRVQYRNRAAMAMEISKSLFMPER
jgi:hypothetical protein